MSISPLVTIITGTYNTECYWQRLMQSIQSQTFGDWEWILVDDGSQDNTVEQLQLAAKGDSRLRVFTKKPEGSPAKSRNFGINEAKGRLICFCDHDDFWAPDKLDIQVQYYRENPNTAVLYTERQLWNGIDAPLNFPRFSYDPSKCKKQSPRSVLYTGQKMLFSSCMTTKKFLDQVNRLDPELRGVDDFYLFIRLSLLGPLVKINIPLTYYYEHDQNLSHTPDLFTDGLYKVHAASVRDQLPQRIQNIIVAQAQKTKAVSLLQSDPRLARPLLWQSLQNYPLAATCMLLVLATVGSLLPGNLLSRLVIKMRGLKARFPTLRDWFSARQ